MSITLSGVTLADPTKEQMYETTANSISFSCSASVPSGTSTSTLQISYSTLTYEWKFSDGGSTSGSSGTHTFTGLAQGAPVTITAEVTVKCTKTTKTRHWISSGYWGTEDPPKWHDTSHWSSWTTKTEELKASGSAQQDANTHPGVSTIFSGLAAEQIIEDNLTSGMVSDWCTHAGKWLSWYYQADNYSGADGCKVSSKDWIEASWYNGCVSTVLASSPSVSGGPNGTIITPSYFQSLDTLVSRRA